MDEMEFETSLEPSFDLGESARNIPKEESPMASLKIHPGWVILEEEIKSRIASLESFNTEGMDFDKIGFYHVLHEKLRRELSTILNIVDSNYEHERGKKDKRADYFEEE